MPETYEKDGIVYFKEPYKIYVIDWLNAHEECDSIVEDKWWLNNHYLVVHCYASKPEYNKILERIRNEQYNNCTILCGIESEEVNSLD